MRCQPKVAGVGGGGVPVPFFGKARFTRPAGIDFKIKTIELDDKKIKLQIW
jgi:hypothetical protein